MSYRSRHRMRSHQEAHDAAADDASIPPVLEHPLVPANAASLITEPQALHDLIERLRGVGSFAYDSEFIGEHTYHPRLCVIQVATADFVTLIDPLQGLDLTPFWELLADASVEKVVHAGVQDLEPVVRHLDEPPANVFDVQIASAFAAVHYPSALHKLVTELLGADLGRGLKFSQWDHRPLSDVQVQYAANDVRYLPLLRRTIAERLERFGNVDWAAEECSTLTDIELYRFDPRAQRIRVRGVETLGPRRRTVLRAMMAWREEVARQEDIPPRALIKDAVLFDLARMKFDSASDLSTVRGLPRPVRERYGESIIAAIVAARSQRAAPESFDWRAARELVVDRERINALWAEVASRAEQRHIHPAIVTSKKELTRYVYAKELGRSRRDMRLSAGWRAELLNGILPG